VIANLQKMTSPQHHNGMMPLQEDDHSMTSNSVGVAATQHPELQREARVPTSFSQARFQPTDYLAALGRRYNEYGGATRNSLYYHSDAY